MKGEQQTMITERKENTFEQTTFRINQGTSFLWMGCYPKCGLMPGVLLSYTGWVFFNPISHGGGVFRPPPNQTFLHCAETTQDMMTKLCDFYSNLIGKQNLNVSLF